MEEKKEDSVPKEAESEIGNKVVAEKEKQRIGFWVEGTFMKVNVPLENPYLALGLLYDCLCDVRDRLSMARAASEKQKLQLAGKDSMTQGLRNNKDFQKKFRK